MTSSGSRVAVIIPCHNEERTVARVVRDFRKELPDADIVVVDNLSTDGTAETARQAGARVVREGRKGKGFALVAGFRAAHDRDYLVMVDGDDTYPAEQVHDLLAALDSGCDMAIGTRLTTHEAGAFPRGHGVGNRMFVLLVRVLFGVRTTDLLSGYRVLTRRFVEYSPLIAQGFEIETELALQALALKFGIAEVPIRYRARPANSHSKLHTFRDGYRIILALVAFLRDYRPLTFFGSAGLLLLFAATVAAFLAVAGVGRLTGEVNGPLVVVAVGLAIISGMCFIGGIILSSVMRRAAETAALLANRKDS